MDDLTPELRREFLTLKSRVDNAMRVKSPTYKEGFVYSINTLTQGEYQTLQDIMARMLPVFTKE
jgi:hypothetical protein